MLPTIIIGALALAILWPFIKLGYELIKLAGSLVLLVASCAIDRQREFVAFRDERLAAAALDPDALGLVPELAAAHGRDAGGKGKALVQDAFLSGVVADLARALLYECLA